MTKTYEVLILVLSDQQARDYIRSVVDRARQADVRVEYSPGHPYTCSLPNARIKCYGLGVRGRLDRVRGHEFNAVYFCGWLEDERDSFVEVVVPSIGPDAEVFVSGSTPDPCELIEDLVPVFYAAGPSQFRREYLGEWAVDTEDQPDPYPAPGRRSGKTWDLHNELVAWRRQVAKYLADALINLPPMPVRTEDTRLQGITIDRYQTKEAMAQAIQAVCAKDYTAPRSDLDRAITEAALKHPDACRAALKDRKDEE